MTTLTLCKPCAALWTLTDRGHYAEAESLYRQLLEMRKRVSGPEAPETLNTMQELGTVLGCEKQHAEAEQLLRQVLETQRRVLGPTHQNTLATMVNFGNVLKQEAKYEEAGALYRDGAEIMSRTLGPDNRNTLLARLNVISIQEKMGHLPEAEKLSKEVLEISRFNCEPWATIIPTLRTSTISRCAIQKPSRFSVKIWKFRGAFLAPAILKRSTVCTASLAS